MRGKGLATLATFLVQLYITTYNQCGFAWLALCEQICNLNYPMCSYCSKLVQCSVNVTLALLNVT